MEQTKWSETVVLIDAEYLERLTLDFIVNFERMINRQLPPADLCQWLDCIALDGGVRPGDNKVQVLFIYPEEQSELKNFHPSSFKKELDGMAFSDNLGEFTLHSFATESIVKRDEFFLQSLETIADSSEVKRLLLIPDPECCEEVCLLLDKTDKDATVFAMEPLAGTKVKTSVLGYPLMSALGIRAEELD